MKTSVSIQAGIEITLQFDTIEEVQAFFRLVPDYPQWIEDYWKRGIRFTILLQMDQPYGTHNTAILFEDQARQWQIESTVLTPQEILTKSIQGLQEKRES